MPNTIIPAGTIAGSTASTTTTMTMTTLMVPDTITAIVTMDMDIIIATRRTTKRDLSSLLP